MTLEAALLFPLICAFIGYTTKWLALKMVFKPDRFVGIGPVGWQGIIQRRADKFSVGIAETIRNAGLDAGLLAERIRSNELAAALDAPLAEAGPELARLLVEALAPGTWDRLTDADKEAAAALVSADGGSLVAELVETALPAIAAGIDISEVVTELLSGENAGRLAHLFRAIGEKEMQWMIRYGAVMGFVIGVVEVGFVSLWHEWWLLPIIGAFDGLINNWLAIQMIFLPRERTVYLGVFPYQGMFPARQREISGNFARVIADEVLTPSNLITRLNASGAMAALAPDLLMRIDGPTQDLLDRLAKTVDIDPVPGATFQAIGALSSVEGTVALAPLVAGIEGYLASALDFEELLEEGLAAMPKEEFETVLRGIFQEDERTLIGLGAVIGGAIGCLQALVAVSLGFI